MSAISRMLVLIVFLSAVALVSEGAVVHAAAYPVVDSLAQSVLFEPSLATTASGQLRAGFTSGEFTGTIGSSHLAVTSGPTPPSPSLEVGLKGHAPSYAYERYPIAYRSHILQFSLFLSSNVTLNANAYVVLAQTAPYPRSLTQAGVVNLILTSTDLTVELFRQRRWSAHLVWSELVRVGRRMAHRYSGRVVKRRDAYLLS